MSYGFIPYKVWQLCFSPSLEASYQVKMSDCYRKMPYGKREALEEKDYKKVLGARFVPATSN
jgi:hypothetical protein